MTVGEPVRFHAKPQALHVFGTDGARSAAADAMLAATAVH